MFQMKVDIEYNHKASQVYSEICRRICRKLSLTQTAFDILMFLGNNPQYSTARDISEIRGIKSNLLSVNVDKLVCAGYLERKPIDNDRRKIALVLTDKARPVITEGQSLQAEFFELCFDGIDKGDMDVFFRVIEQSEANLDKMIKKGK